MRKKELRLNLEMDDDRLTYLLEEHDLWDNFSNYLGEHEMTAESIAQILFMQKEGAGILAAAYQREGLDPPPARIEIPVHHVDKIIRALIGPKHPGGPLSLLTLLKRDMVIRAAKRYRCELVAKGTEYKDAEREAAAAAKERLPSLTERTIERALQSAENGKPCRPRRTRR